MSPFLCKKPRCANMASVNVIGRNLQQQKCFQAEGTPVICSAVTYSNGISCFFKIHVYNLDSHSLHLFTRMFSHFAERNVYRPASSKVLENIRTKFQDNLTKFRDFGFFFGGKSHPGEKMGGISEN